MGMSLVNLGDLGLNGRELEKLGGGSQKGGDGGGSIGAYSGIRLRTLDFISIKVFCRRREGRRDLRIYF